MSRLLIICGPTATGKTSFALVIAKKYHGELISADSRQVYAGMDIVTGKDLPPQCPSQISNLTWKNRPLKYYTVGGVKVWLYDVVNPDEPFNISYWKDCADLLVSDIHSRGRLPIIVGGTGLYLKSFSQSLSQINIPPNSRLRIGFVDKSPEYLFDYLNRLDPFAAGKMNSSDRCNPRRLIRAIEIATLNPPSLESREGGMGGELFKKKKSAKGLGGCYESREGGMGGEVASGDELLQIGLTAPKDYLYALIDRRVDRRLAAGAAAEAANMSKKYPHHLPAMTASGYQAFTSDHPFEKWIALEHQYVRRQLTWFKKQPGITWFDISRDSWQRQANETITDWYNKKVSPNTYV